MRVVNRVVLLMSLVAMVAACGADSSAEAPTTGTPSSDTASSEESSSDTPATSDDSSQESPEEPWLPETGDELRDGAMQLSLELVNTYFENDGERFFSFVEQELPVAGTTRVRQKEEYENSLLNNGHFPAGFDYTAHTMDEYLEVYNPVVVTFTEAAEQFGLPMFEEDGWVPADDEFIFVGWMMKPEKSITDEIVHRELLLWIVGQRDGEWRLVGLVPSP